MYVVFCYGGSSRLICGLSLFIFTAILRHRAHVFLFLWVWNLKLKKYRSVGKVRKWQNQDSDFGQANTKVAALKPTLYCLTSVGQHQPKT